MAKRCKWCSNLMAISGSTLATVRLNSCMAYFKIFQTAPADAALWEPLMTRAMTKKWVCVSCTCAFVYKMHTSLASAVCVHEGWYSCGLWKFGRRGIGNRVNGGGGAATGWLRVLARPWTRLSEVSGPPSPPLYAILSAAKCEEVCRPVERRVRPTLIFLCRKIFA